MFFYLPRRGLPLSANGASVWILNLVPRALCRWVSSRFFISFLGWVFGPHECPSGTHSPLFFLSGLGVAWFSPSGYENIGVLFGLYSSGTLAFARARFWTRLFFSLLVPGSLE